jgi:hypothetical protein
MVGIAGLIDMAVFSWRYGLLWGLTRDLPRRLARSWRILRDTWAGSDDDWYSLLAMMRSQLLAMATAVEGHRYGSARRAREIRVCAELARRMLDDVAFEQADLRVPGYGRRWADQCEALHDQYMEMLLRYLRRFPSWWV